MDFELRKVYEELSEKELKFPLIDELKKFKDKCLTVGNSEYAYKADCLIADVYLEHSSYDEPLKLLTTDIKEIDPSVFQNIYLDFINRILFIYITKKNYNLALKYSALKEKFIDVDNLDQVNRFLLEKTHIYTQMDEIDKAIECLNKIIEHPTDAYIRDALSDITNLYIDKKNVVLAEQYFNKCLALNDNDEGRIYCDYLLAKICILKENYNDALVLLKQIFENEDINQMTLPMVNDYLELLYNLKKYDEMALTISKIALFINACDDLYIQKQFVKNKINYLIASKNTNQLQDVFKEYEIIDKKINENEKRVTLEINEKENYENVQKAVDGVTNNLDTLIAVFNNNASYSNIRDLIMSFNKNLQKCVLFEESSFVLINKPIQSDSLPSKDINLYHYKNGKLYEKLLQHTSLSKSLVELVINHNKPIAFDLNKNKIEIINLFTNRKYVEENQNYVYAIPCFYQGGCFGVMIFSSSNFDMSEKNNAVLFDFATKIFESNIITYFIKDLYLKNKEMVDNTILNESVGIIKFNDDDMYLSDSLVKIFKQKSNFIKRRSYMFYISKNDLERYKKVTEANQYKISYKLSIGSLFVSVTENVNSCFDNENNFLYKYGTITVDQGSIKTLIDGKTLLDNKLKELVFDNYDNQLKFALIRLRTNPEDFDLIRKTFGCSPYYLSDSDCVVVYENESSTQYISNLAQSITDDYTIIRYPRDTESIDELLKRSEIMMQHNSQIFDREIYQDYIKEETANKLASNSFINIDSKAKLSITRYNSYDDEIWISPNLYYDSLNSNNELDSEDAANMSAEENIRDLLSEENRIKYDIKLFRTVIDYNIKVNTLIFINSKSLKKLYDRGLINENTNNINFVLSDSNVNDVNGLIEKVNDYANIFIDGKLLKNISIYNFDRKKIKGLYLSKGIILEDREALVNLAKRYMLPIVSGFKMNDSNKNIYATKDIKVIE